MITITIIECIITILAAGRMLNENVDEDEDAEWRAYKKMITNRLGFERVARMCAANRKREKMRRRENYEHIIQSTWPFGLYLRVDLCLPVSNRCATRFSFTNKR